MNYPKLTQWARYVAVPLVALLIAGCDRGQRPLDVYGNGSPPPMPKIAVGDFSEYPAPGFPANGRHILLDALRSQLQEQGMLWNGDSSPRIDLTGNLQAYEGRYATPADDSVVVDLSGELRDGSKILVKSQVNRHIRPGSDWNVEIGQMADQLLNDLRSKISVSPSNSGVSGAPGYYGYPSYSAGSYYPSSYYYDPYYMNQPYYYGYYGPSYVNMYWLSYYWSGRHHHDRDHHDGGGHHEDKPRPHPQPFPPGVTQAIPRTHAEDRHSPGVSVDHRPINESIRNALPRSQDNDRPTPQTFIENSRGSEVQKPTYSPAPAIMAIPRTSHPRDGGGASPPSQDFSNREQIPSVSQPYRPSVMDVPRSQSPSIPAPSFSRPEIRPNTMDVPHRPTFNSRPMPVAPPVSMPSFRPPQVHTAPIAPPVPRAAPSPGGGGGFGGLAPGSQRRHR